MLRIPPCILLDRDGVLNVNRKNYVRHVTDLEMAPFATDGCALLTRAGYTLLVVTNQAGIAKGVIDPMELERIHRALQDAVAAAGGRIERFYVCPHQPLDACDCRKPAPGLIHQAQRDYGFTPKDTWFAGDSMRDMHAAQAGGCKAAFVEGCGYRDAHGHFDPNVSDVHHFQTLLDFAKFVTAG